MFRSSLRRNGDWRVALGAMILLPLVFLGCSQWQSWRLHSAVLARDRAIAQVQAEIVLVRALAGSRQADRVLHDGQGRAELPATRLVRLQAQREQMRTPTFAERVVASALVRAGTLFSAAAALLGFLSLFMLDRLGRSARASRDALLRNYVAARRMMLWLPGLMAAGQIVAGACLAGCEFVLWHAREIHARDYEMLANLSFLACGLVMMGVAWGVRTVSFSRQFFQPPSVTVTGYVATREVAARLWGFVQGIARQIGAPLPVHIIVGFEGDCFMTGARVRLTSGECLQPGHVLYLPLPAVAYLNRRELAAIVCRELACYVGEEARYATLFAPLHLEADTRYHTGVLGGADERTNIIGHCCMLAFAEAARHWRRQHDLASLRWSGSVAGAEAMAVALLRTRLLAVRVQDVVQVCREGSGAQACVLALIDRMVRERGLDDPTLYLGDTPPHPTDPRLPIVQQLAALGMPRPPAAVLARARDPQRSDQLAELALDRAPEGMAIASQADALGALPHLVRQLQRPLCEVVEKAFARDLAAGFGGATTLRRRQLAALCRGEFALHESRRGNFASYLVFGLLAAILGTWALPINRLAGAAVLCAGALCLYRGVVAVLSERHVVVTLTPAGVAFAGAERILPWSAIEACRARPRAASGRAILLHFRLGRGDALPAGVLGERALYDRWLARIVVEIPDPAQADVPCLHDLMQEYWRNGHAGAASVAPPAEHGSLPARVAPAV